MDEETRVLLEVRVDRSREDIETAKELVDLGRYRAAVNRHTMQYLVLPLLCFLLKK